MQSFSTGVLALILFTASQGAVTAPASERRVQELLAEYDEALTSESAYDFYTVLVRMSDHDNAEFGPPAQKAIRYKATRTDKKEVAVEADRLDVQDKDEVEELVLQRELMVQEAGAKLLGNIPGKDSIKALTKALKDKKFRSERPTLIAAVVDSLGRLQYTKAEKDVVSLFRKGQNQAVLRASSRFFGQVKTRDLDVVLLLCRELEPPEQPPGNIPNSPTVSGTPKRSQLWFSVSKDIAWSLEQITGQKFEPGTRKAPGDGKKAAAWVKEHARELGLR